MLSLLTNANTTYIVVFTVFFHFAQQALMRIKIPGHSSWSFSGEEMCALKMRRVLTSIFENQSASDVIGKKMYW